MYTMSQLRTNRRRSALEAPRSGTRPERSRSFRHGGTAGGRACRPRSGGREKEMAAHQNNQLTRGLWRSKVGVLLAAGCVVYAGCASATNPPLYAQADLKTICERQGGWWRPDALIPG